MSENLRWYQRKFDMFLAAVFAVVALVLDKAIQKILTTSPAFFDENPWIRTLLQWIAIIMPWIILSVFIYLYLKWKNKANAQLITLNRESK